MIWIESSKTAVLRQPHNLDCSPLEVTTLVMRAIRSVYPTARNLIILPYGSFAPFMENLLQITQISFGAER